MTTKYLFALLTIAAVLIATRASAQDATVVFVGVPVRKVSEAGLSRVPEALSPEKASAALCVISQSGNDFFWTSRNNRTLYKIDGGGAFITFVAPDAGYIRVIKPEYKAAASLMSETEAKFDYIEHMTNGLRTITYWGNRVSQ
jgi:hypothetical protein